MAATLPGGLSLEQIASASAGANPRRSIAAGGACRNCAAGDGAFRILFRKSPVNRIGRDRFVRNVLIAIGNAAMRNWPETHRASGHFSPLVRAAVWALERLLRAKTFWRCQCADRARSGSAGQMDRYFFFLTSVWGQRGFGRPSSAARYVLAASWFRPRGSNSTPPENPDARQAGPPVSR